MQCPKIKDMESRFQTSNNRLVNIDVIGINLDVANLSAACQVKGTGMTKQSHYAILDICLPPQLHCSQVKHFQITIVVTSTKCCVCVIVRVACFPRQV